MACASFSESHSITQIVMNSIIAIGWRAGFGGSGDNNIYLGNQPFPATVPNESRVMRLGSFEQSTFIQRTFIAGIFPVPVSGPVVRINSAGQLGIRVSSARYKRDIQPMGAHSRGLFQLRPVTFRYKQDVQGERQYGLIAEEVAKVYPELVTRGANGKVEAVRYEDLMPMLLNELQHQQRQLGAQAQQLSVLTAENERLQAMVVQQQERDAAVAARLERLEAAAARAAALASR
jgi:hypothetical protein